MTDTTPYRRSVIDASDEQVAAAVCDIHGALTGAFNWDARQLRAALEVAADLLGIDVSTRCPLKRYALVSMRGDSREAIERYLPANYAAAGEVELTNFMIDTVGPSNAISGEYLVIEGKDNAGWTLDDYVIPRLQSGLITAFEIDLSHPVMRTI